VSWQTIALHNLAVFSRILSGVEVLANGLGSALWASREVLMAGTSGGPAREIATPDRLIGDQRKESLDLIEPRGMRRIEVASAVRWKGKLKAGEKFNKKIPCDDTSPSFP
jgi:hypothetical protein